MNSSMRKILEHKKISENIFLVILMNETIFSTYSTFSIDTSTVISKDIISLTPGVLVSVIVQSVTSSVKLRSAHVLNLKKLS